MSKNYFRVNFTILESKENYSSFDWVSFRGKPWRFSSFTDLGKVFWVFQRKTLFFLKVELMHGYQAKSNVWCFISDEGLGYKLRKSFIKTNLTKHNICIDSRLLANNPALDITFSWKTSQSLLTFFHLMKSW
jgi:hypothetical protein